MDTGLLISWSFQPSILLGLSILGLAYAVALARVGWAASPAQILAFALALLTLALALLSPLDTLADRALFSAHMLQHLMLLLVAPALLLLGLPAEAFRRASQSSPLRAVLGLLAPPLPAFLLSLLTLWLWHLPALYDAALYSEPLHALEHLSFLGSALLFWWPIVRPGTYYWPFPEILQIVALFGAAVGSTMLAALITFSASILYPAYALGGPPAAVHAALGLTPLMDQQMGGLMMWVAGGAWYFGAAGVVFARLFFGRDADEPASDTSHRHEKGVTT